LPSKCDLQRYTTVIREKRTAAAAAAAAAADAWFSKALGGAVQVEEFS
jgi:hypothetical protein